MSKKQTKRFKVPSNLPRLTLADIAKKYSISKRVMREVTRDLVKCGAISKDSGKLLLEEIKQL